MAGAVGEIARDEAVTVTTTTKAAATPTVKIVKGVTRIKKGKGSAEFFNFPALCRVVSLILAL